MFSYQSSILDFQTYRKCMFTNTLSGVNHCI